MAQQQVAVLPQKINLSMSGDVLNAVFYALGKLPMEQVESIVADFRTQVQAQIKPVDPTTPETSKE